ncbi:MAG: hypothetical protein IJU76_11545 [Desulfovibrionaceae bacterium]|nr:hypothetical protein [Desulfovibrionaceae bacterium]
MAKKSFIQRDPEKNFINIEPGDEEQEPKPAQPKPSATHAPKGYKVNPLYVETKSRRLQLVVQPSLFEKVKRGAAAAGLSVNEFVHQILEKATMEEEEEQEEGKS